MSHVTVFAYSDEFDSSDGSEGSGADFSGFDSDDLPLQDLIARHYSSSSDDNDDASDLAPPPPTEWSNRFTQPTIEAFTETQGPNLPADFDTVTATPLDFFWLLFPPDLITWMVTCTNGYAAWVQRQPGARPDSSWEDTDEAEMKAFLGINICFGLQKNSNLEMYWSRDPFERNNGIAQTMTCNRFQKILQYFHVSDRDTEPDRQHPDYDRLCKIRPILTRLTETFKRCYTLSREVSIDKGMIAFAGRLSFRQYMPAKPIKRGVKVWMLAKPIKRGVKVWMLADANNAYLSRFEFYLGRKETGTEHGLGYNVVMSLSDHLYQTHRHLFFDNYFTGVELMEQLLENGLYACGTVRPGRKGFPTQLKKSAAVKNRGEYRVLQKGDTNLTASVWMDKKHVHHLSTLSNPMRPTMTQRRIGANVVPLPIPESVHSYNKFMGGVDLNDQHRACYSVGRKGKKFWRYMFWFMLNISIVNAFILYKAASTRLTKKKRFCHRDFRSELLKQLIGGFSKRKRSFEPGHFAGIVDKENIGNHVNSKIGKSRHCKYHWTVKNQRRETVYGCCVCMVPLCKDCHAVWHNTQYGVNQ